MAKTFLEQQGLIFVGSNFHSRYGEIDLIFKEQNTLVFVEVRYRNNTAYGNSLETVGYHKQRKIIKTAQHYLHLHKMTESVVCRFDVIGIDPQVIENKQSPTSIQWVKNAFSSF